MAIEQLGSYTLEQWETVFPLGGDTVDLANFLTLPKGGRVCDLGCGSGALGLLMLQREPTLQMTAVDIDPIAVELTKKNYHANGVQGEMLCENFGQSTLPVNHFDLMVSNPPYFRQGTGGDGGCPRMEGEATLDQLCNTVKKGLKNKGRFGVVYPVERLSQLLVIMSQHGIEPKRLQLVQHSMDHKPSVALVEGMKQGKTGLEILPVRIRIGR